jgi:glyoxylase-like metal-dependent hydrolase (beta-lactamase superfamily II)
LHDGQRLWLAANWPLEVHHAPGHTVGHLALLDLGQQSAFIGDAVGWKGSPLGGGSMQFPLYMDPEAYMATIDRIQSWTLEYLCTSHYSTLRGKEISDFLDDSRTFVVDLDRAVRQVLEGTRTREGLREITRAVLEIMGGQYVFDICAVNTIDAHARRFKEQGHHLYP